MSVPRPVLVAATLLFAAACSDSPTQPIESGPMFHHVGGLDGGAAFEVNVTVTATLIPDLTGPVGTEFPNCYTFQADGVWIDPGFPVPGTWTQRLKRGTAIYTATAEWVEQGLLLKQRGMVKLFQGRRKLKAYTKLKVVADGTVLAEFLSRGHEVDSCSPPL